MPVAINTYSTINMQMCFITLRIICNLGFKQFRTMTGTRNLKKLTITEG